jgi:hypothetical protein
MDESLQQPENAATFTSPPVRAVDFWQSFRLFASRIDESGFTHWYVYIVGSYILFFIPFLLQNSNLIKLFTPQEMAFYKENLWLNLIIGIAVVLIVLSFNLWRSIIQQTFERLGTKQRICLKNEHGDLDQEYRAFLDEYQADLLSTRRYFLTALLMVACVILVWALLIPYVSFSAQLSPLLLFVTPGALVLGYFVGISSWIMIMSGIRLRALTLKFTLNIEPTHPDNCGGLRFLGNFCLGMALPILAGVTFFGLYGIGGAIFPALIHDRQAAKIEAILGLIMFDAPLAFFSFFFPLWCIHQEMAECKEAYEDIFGDYLSQLEKKLWAALKQKRLVEAKDIKEEIEIAQVINPDIQGYPSWPFDRRIFLIYLLPQALPILGILLPLFIH